MSALARSAPFPNSMLAMATWLTETYCKEHRAGSMASFTLLPVGKDRSVIIRHLLGWCFLGITPKRFV